MSDEHFHDETDADEFDITTRKRPRVCDLPGGIPMHWWLYLTRQYQDGLFGRDAGFDFHVLSQFQFDVASPRQWYTRVKPWSGIILHSINQRNVTRINLSGSKLVQLPESIGDLELLEDLFLCYNCLVTLPESIGDLKSLRRLLISDNELTTLPESIGDLHALILLYMPNNKLVTLPESMNKLKSLIHLDVSENELSTLPESINKLKSLIHLDMNHNKLVTLPDSISELVSLTYISVSENPVSSTKDKQNEIIRRFARLRLSMDIF